jgi:FlaA1/EpsC-like NDP-sugar epimerase
MSISQAVHLSFKAIEIMKNREIFVLKMSVLTVGDLAKATMEAYKEKYDIKKDISIKIIGKKEGERIHEKLLTIEESEVALELEDMFIILPNLLNPGSGYELMGENVKLYPKSKRAQLGDYSSVDAKKMSVPEIKNMLLLNEDLKW